MKLYLIAFALAFSASMASAQPGAGGRGPTPDADGDGKVVLAEFEAADAARQGRILARLDTNKDGKISPDEIRAMAPPSNATRPGGPGRGGLMRLDTDTDGFVTREELLASSQRRFEAADANKDGWLSQAEMDMMRQRMRGPGPQ